MHRAVRARLRLSSIRSSSLAARRHAGLGEVDRQFRHPDPDLHHARLGPEHRGRPRRPARSRLRRLLRGRRLFLRAAAPRPSACRSGSAAARRHSRRVLGHPARLSGAAAARRLSRHRHAGLRRDHPPRADQLGRLHQRLCRHLRHPAPDLLRHSVQRHRRRLRRRLRPRIHAALPHHLSLSTSSWRWRC